MQVIEQVAHEEVELPPPLKLKVGNLNRVIKVENAIDGVDTERNELSGNLGRHPIAVKEEEHLVHGHSPSRQLVQRWQLVEQARWPRALVLRKCR